MIAPAALRLARECLLREARFQYSAVGDRTMALELVRSARALGAMDEEQEAEAARIEKRARPVRLDEAA